MIIEKDLNIFAYFVVSRIKVYLSLLAKLKTNGRNLKWKFHSQMIQFLNDEKITKFILKKSCFNKMNEMFDYCLTCSMNVV